MHKVWQLRLTGFLTNVGQQHRLSRQQINSRALQGLGFRTTGVLNPRRTWAWGFGCLGFEFEIFASRVYRNCLSIDVETTKPVVSESSVNEKST